MCSKLGMFAASLAESSWLAAVVVVPVFFNVYSRETFEPDKAFLLRSLAALALAGASVWCMEEGRAAWTLGDRPIWRTPLVRPVLALTCAYLVATSFSIAPHLSLWGSYIRMQGLATWLSYVIFFLAVLVVARERERIERLVTALLLASLAPALYGIMQHFDRDPIDWGQSTAARVTGTAGNPIFLSALLIMVLPLTAARLLERLAPAGDGGRAPRRRAGRAVAYLALLIVQTAAIYFSQSRGPTVGLGCGLAAFALLAALVRRIRWPVWAVGAVAGAALFFSIALPATGMLGRISHVFAWQEASGRVRVFIWTGVTDLLASNPVRSLVGYGPETMMLAFNRVYPAELAVYERPDSAPDRAHNDTLDSLVTVGLLGCASELILILACFVHVLRRLGVIATTAQRNGFVAVTVSGGMIGGTAPLVTAGSVAFSSLGLGLGIAAGVLAYLTVLALRRARRAARPPERDAPLLMALFAGIMGHFVEMQVGIATSATRLYFFVSAGLALAISMQSPPPAAASERPAAGAPRPVLLGAIAGLMLITMSVDFYTPTTDLRAHGATLAAVFLAVWLVGAALALEEVARGEGAAASWLRAARGYAAASAGPWLSFVGVFKPWIDWPPARGIGVSTSVAAFGLHLTRTVSLFYAALFLGVVCIAMALMWRHAANRKTRWQGAVCGTVLLGAALAIVHANLRASHADCFAKLGEAYERARSWPDAVRAHEQAVRLSPWRQEYAVNLARVLIERARHTADRNPQQRDADAARAIQLTEDTARANPLNPDHPGNLARMYRKWARLSDPANRSLRFERAAAAYQQALALWPNNLVLWNELALLHLERGQLERTLQLFDENLQRNQHFLETYVRRAQVFAATQHFDAAAADYRRVRQLTADSAGLQDDLVTLYQQTHQLERALAEARGARTQAAASTFPTIDQFIQRLEARLAASPR